MPSKYIPATCRHCGTSFSALTSEIKRGAALYCSRACVIASRRPVVGATFGRLTITGPFTDEDNVTYVVCACACGTVKRLRLGNIKSGSTKSCGCWKNEGGPKPMLTHGETNTPLFRTWTSMRSRCTYPSTINWENYGGRGITVCPEWANDFVAFRDWALAHGWEQGLDMDRIDNDGNYEPGNVRFVPRTVNMRNRRMTLSVTAFGETKPLSDWIDDPRCPAPYYLVHQRLKHGWEPERALTTPAHSYTKSGHPASLTGQD